MAINPKKQASNAAWYAANRDKILSNHRDYYRADIAAKRENGLKREYGLTSEQFDKMAEAQGHHCAICSSDTPGRKFKHWHVDHDHSTGRVRGLLCASCNIMLGAAKDNSETLKAAIKYLANPPARPI